MTKSTSIKKNLNARIRILQLATLVVLFLLLVPLQSPFSDPEFVDPSRIDGASTSNHLLADSSTVSGTGDPLSIVYSGITSNRYDSTFIIDSSNSETASTIVTDGWTATNPLVSLDSLSVDTTGEVQNAYLTDYHNEYFLDTASPSTVTSVPNYWTLTKIGDAQSNHPTLGTFELNRVAGAGYGGSMGWRFDADWSGGHTLASTDEVYISQLVTLPYRDVYSAEVTFRYYLTSGSALDDLVFLFVRFEGTMTEFHVFESGDARTTWLQASVTVSNSVIQSLVTPGNILLEIGLATDESGSASSSANHQVYVDDILINLNVQPFAEQIDLAANGTRLQDSSYASVHPYLPDDGNNRSAYDDPTSGIDLDGYSGTGLDVGIWGSYVSSDVFETGLQFPIDIPQGAAIVNAYLEVESAGTDGVPDMRIRIADTDDVGPFQSGLPHMEDLYTYVDYSVDWDASSWTSGVRYTSPNIGPLIQEIIAQSGWISGNYISLILDYMYSGDPTVYNTIKGDASFDDTTSDHNMPRLHIEYIVSSTQAALQLLRHSKPITISSSLTSSDLTNFPIMIDIIDTDLKTDVQSDGDDIAFSIDGMALSHEIELFDQSYSGSEAHLIAWVKIPTLSSSSNTVIMMHYGNPTIDSLEDSSGVWDNGFEAVFHLASDPTAGAVQDSTINGYDGDALNMESGDATTGMIGTAYDFDGSDERVQVGPIDSNSWTQLTLSGWIYADDALGDDRLIAKEEGTGGGPHIFMLGYDNNQIKFRVYTDGSGGTQLDVTTSSLPIDSWSYIALTFDAALATNEVSVYINGSSIGSWTLDGTSIRDSGVDVFLGDNTQGTRSFDGRGDELRIASVTRPSAWLLAEYRNQLSPSTYISIGSETDSYTWVDEHRISVGLTTSSPSPVTTDIVFSLDIEGSGQSIDESFNPGATFYARNGTNIVDWIAYAMISPPNTTTELNAYVDYPMTQWNPVAVANPLGQNKTYGSDWDFQGGTITVYSDAIDYWGLWKFFFEGWNHLQNLQLGISGESLGNTATFDINDVAAFRATTPYVTGARVGLSLTDPTGSVWYESYATTSGSTSHAFPSFQYRRTITIQSSQVTADLTNFPVLVDITSSDFQTKIQADADDILFVDASNNILSHELDLFDQGTGRIRAWVKANISGSVDTVLTMYYGNPVLGSQEYPDNVWSNGYDAVWHLGEDATDEGTSAIYYDSTANHYDANQRGTDHVTAGKIGHAQQLDGTNDRILVNSTEELDPSGDTWLSGWFYIGSAFSSSSTTSQLILSKYLSDTDNMHVLLAGTDYNQGTVPAGSMVLKMDRDSSPTYKWTQRVTWAAGWYHFTIFIDTSSWTTCALYINGADNTNTGSSGSGSGTLAFTGDWGIGGGNLDTYNIADGDAFLNGRMDEVRVSTGARTVSWIQTEYNNQNTPSSFVSLGSESARTSPEHTITKTIDSSAPAGIWTVTMHFNDTGSTVTNSTGVYEREFLVKHDTTLTLNFPSDAVSDKTAYATAGEPIYIEYELTDDTNSNGVPGATVRLNWTVSGTPTQITMDDLGDGRYGKTLDTDDLVANKKWRVNIWSYHPYYNNDTDYFDIDLYHATNMSYIDVESTPVGEDFTATLVFYDSYSGSPIAGATITFDNGTAVSFSDEGSGRYSITVSSSNLGFGDYWYRFKATKASSFLEDAYCNVTFTLRKHYTAISVSGDLLTPSGFSTDLTVSIIDTDTGGTISIGSVSSWTFNPASYDDTTETPPSDFLVTLDTTVWAIGTDTVTLSVILTGNYYSPSNYLFDIEIRKHYTSVTVQGDFLTPHGFTTDVTVILTDIDTGTTISSTSSITSWTFNPASYSDTTETPPGDFDVTIDTSSWAVGTDTVTFSVTMTGIYEDPDDFLFDIEIRKHYTLVSVSGDLITPYGQTTSITVTIIDMDTGTALGSTSSITSWTFNPASHSDTTETPPGDFAVTLDTSSWAVGTDTVTLSVVMTGIYNDPSNYDFDIEMRKHRTAVSVVGEFVTPSGGTTDVTVVIRDLDTGSVLSSISSITSWTFNPVSYSDTTETPPGDFDVTLDSSSWSLGIETVTLSVTMSGIYDSPSSVQFDITIRKHYTSVTVSGNLITPYGFSTALAVIITDSDLGTVLASTTNVASWTFNPASYGDTTENPPGDFAVTLDTSSWTVATETVTLTVTMSGIYENPASYQFNIQIRKHYTAVSVTGDMVSPYGNTTALTVIITDLDTNSVLGSTTNVASWTFDPASYGDTTETPPGDFAVTLDTSSWAVGIETVTLTVTMSGIYSNPSNYQFSITITNLDIDVYNEPNDLIFPTGSDFKIIVRVNVSEPGIYYGDPLTGLLQGEFSVSGYTIKEWYNLGNGRYNFTIDDSSFPEGTYTINLKITTSSSTYGDATLQITFKYRPALSEASSPDRAAVTPYGTDFIVEITYTDIDRDIGITGATITSEGITFYNQQEIDTGVYQVTINVTGLAKGEHLYNLTIDKAGYEAAKLSFKVVIRIAYTYAIPTVGALDIPVGDDVVFYVEYWDIDHDVPIDDTSPFLATSTWNHSVTFTYIPAQERYRVDFPTFEDDSLVQNYIITFNFSKGENYQFGIFNISITIRTHYTDFRLVSAVEPTSYNDNITISVFYGDLDSGTGIASSDIAHRIWNGTNDVTSYLYNDTGLGGGYYLLIVPAPQFGGLGLQSFTIYFNWTGDVYTYKNSTLITSVNIIGEDSRLSLLVTAEPTPYLENMTYTLLFAAVNGTGIYNNTGNVFVSVIFEGLSVDLSEVDIWEINPATNRGEYSIRFNNSIFSATGLIYMKVFFNWSFGVEPFYTNRTDTISVRVLARDTLISVSPPSQTAFAENATFSFTYDDVTGALSEPIANDASLTIVLGLTEYSLSYDSPTKTFIISFNTSQLLTIGPHSFTLSITWIGTPFYANQTGKSISITVTLRQTTLDFQSPAPTQYLDNVTFSVFWTDVAGASSFGISGADLFLYDGAAQIPGQYYSFQELTAGEYEVELSTEYKTAPGYYTITVNISSSEEYYELRISSRTLNIRFRTTLVSSEPIDLVPFNSSVEIILYYQDIITLLDIDNDTSDVSIELLTAGNWIFTSQWQSVNGYYVITVETYNQMGLQIGVQYPLQFNLTYSYQSPFYRWDDITVFFEIRYRESTLERTVAPTQTPYLDYANFTVYYIDADADAGIAGASLYVYDGPTLLTLSSEYLYSAIGGGVYEISVLTSVLGGPGSHGITVCANWTSGSPYHDNASLDVTINIIRRVTNVEIVTPPSLTSYLENVTFIVSFIDSGTNTELTVTKNLLELWNGGTQLAPSDFSISPLGNTYEININSTLLSSILVINQNLTVRVDWPDSPNYYRDDSTSTRYTLIVRSTYVSVDRPANTAYGENATFTFTFVDSTGATEENIPNSSALQILTNLVETPSLTYEPGTKTFTMVFNTSQFGAIGLQSFILGVTWSGTPYYANKTSNTVYVTVTLRQTQVDFETPDPTPYGDSVNFTISFLDIAGASSYGIGESTLALYYNSVVIAGTYYNVTHDGYGTYEVQFDSGYFATPGAYTLNASLVYTGSDFKENDFATRSINVLARNTLLSAEPVGSIGYATVMNITLIFQDSRTQSVIGNLTGDVTLQILTDTGTPWDFNITWNSGTETYTLSVATDGQPLVVGPIYQLQVRLTYAYIDPFYSADDVFISYTIRTRTSLLTATEPPVPTAFGENATIIMYYEDTDVYEGISGATIIIDSFVLGTDYFVVEGAAGFYNILFDTSVLGPPGTYSINITADWNAASVPYHNDAVRRVLVGITQRNTEVEVISPPSQTSYLDNVTLTFVYVDKAGVTDQRVAITASDIKVYADGSMLMAGQFSLIPKANNAFQLSINSTILGATLVSDLNLTIYVDWSEGVSPYYEDDKTELLVSTVGRTLSATFGQIITTPIGDNMTISFTVVDSVKKTYVAGAIIEFECIGVTLEEGVSYWVTEGTGVSIGRYNITINTFWLLSIGDFNFLLNITWNPLNSPYYADLLEIPLTGSVDLIWTSLQSDLPIPSSVQISGNTSVLVYFKDLDHGQVGIIGATISVTYAHNSQVPSDLAWFEQSPGVYNLTFSTRDLLTTGSYTLDIVAERSNYETGLISPSFTVSVIRTTLSADEDTIQLYWSQSAFLKVDYEDLLHLNLTTGATISYTWKGGSGIFSEYGSNNGTYYAYIDTSTAVSGTQVVTITASKTRFASAVVTITLIVLTLPTDLIPLDPVEQTLGLPRGSPVPITIYLNDTLNSQPVEDSYVTRVYAIFQGIEYDLSYTGTPGRYSVTIPGSATELPITFYTIRISSEIQNYDPAGYSFKIDLEQTLTNVKVVDPLNSLGETRVSVVYSSNVTFVLNFTEQVSGETINATDEFFWEISELTLKGDFEYNFTSNLWEATFNTLNGGAFGTYGVTFIGIPSSPQLATNSTTLTLTITKIKTEVIGPSIAPTVTWGWIGNVSFYYNDTSFNRPATGATLGVTWGGIGNRTYYDMGDGTYLIPVDTNFLIPGAKWSVVVDFDLENYETGTGSIQITVEEIATEIVVYSPEINQIDDNPLSLQIPMGDTVTIQILYNDTDDTEGFVGGIVGAYLDPNSEFDGPTLYQPINFTLHRGENGLYYFTFDTMDLAIYEKTNGSIYLPTGTFTYYVALKLENRTLASVLIRFRIIQVPTSINPDTTQLNQAMVNGRDLTLDFYYNDTWHGLGIDDAIFYAASQSGAVTILENQTLGDGWYRLKINAAQIGGSVVTVHLQKRFFANVSISYVITISPNEQDILFQNTLTYGLPISLLVIVLLGAYVKVWSVPKRIRQINGQIKSLRKGKVPKPVDDVKSRQQLIADLFNDTHKKYEITRTADMMPEESVPVNIPEMGELLVQLSILTNLGPDELDEFKADISKMKMSEQAAFVKEVIDQEAIRAARREGVSMDEIIDRIGREAKLRLTGGELDEAGIKKPDVDERIFLTPDEELDVDVIEEGRDIITEEKRDIARDIRTEEPMKITDKLSDYEIEELRKDLQAKGVQPHEIDTIIEQARELPRDLVDELLRSLGVERE